MNYQSESIHGYYFNLKARYRRIIVARSKNKKEHQQQRKSDYLIKVSQEFCDSISAVVCQKRKYNNCVTFKSVTRRDASPFLLRKNVKLSKTRETAIKYAAKLSFLENSYRKRIEKEKKESMKSPSKYYSTIEMEDEDPDPSLQ